VDPYARLDVEKRILDDNARSWEVGCRHSPGDMLQVTLKDLESGRGLCQEVVAAFLFPLRLKKGRRLEWRAFRFQSYS
jgi:hypothetical protein